MPKIIYDADGNEREVVLANYVTSVAPIVVDGELVVMDGTTGLIVRAGGAYIDSGTQTLEGVSFPHGNLDVDAAAPNRFLTRDGSGVFVDTANPSLAQLQHGHEDAAGGGQMNAGNVFNAGLLPLARGGLNASLTGAARGVLSLWDSESAVSIRAMGGYEITPFTELGSPATNITISSIPASYRNLLLKVWLRSDRAASTFDAVLARLNGDTTATNYYGAIIFENTTTTQVANAGGTATFITSNSVPAASMTAGYFAQYTIWINNYSSSSRFRFIEFTGVNALSEVASGLNTMAGYCTWKNNSAAVNSISLAPVTGTNFIAGSAYQMWGF